MDSIAAINVSLTTMSMGGAATDYRVTCRVAHSPFPMSSSMPGAGSLDYPSESSANRPYRTKTIVPPHHLIRAMTAPSDMNYGISSSSSSSGRSSKARRSSAYDGSTSSVYPATSSSSTTTATSSRASSRRPLALEYPAQSSSGYPKDSRSFASSKSSSTAVPSPRRAHPSASLRRAITAGEWGQPAAPFASLTSVDELERRRSGRASRGSRREDWSDGGSVAPEDSVSQVLGPAGRRKQQQQRRQAKNAWGGGELGGGEEEPRGRTRRRAGSEAPSASGGYVVPAERWLEASRPPGSGFGAARSGYVTQVFVPGAY